MKRLITDILVTPDNIYYSFSIKSRLNNLINKYDTSVIRYFISTNYFNGDKIYTSFILYNEFGNVIDIPEEIYNYYSFILTEPEWCFLYGYNQFQTYSTNFLKIMLENLELENYETKMNEEGLLINLSNYSNYMDIYENISLGINDYLQEYINYAYLPSKEIIEEWNMVQVDEYFYKVNINPLFYKNYGTIFDFFEYIKMGIPLFKILYNQDDHKINQLKERYNIDIDKNIIILKERLTFDMYVDIINILTDN